MGTGLGNDLNDDDADIQILWSLLKNDIILLY
jgi:hypothetical protein